MKLEESKLTDEERKELTKAFKSVLSPKPGDMNHLEWVESLRVLYCTEKKDFIECFGEKDGPYLWSKYVDYKQGDVFSFLCYLDGPNTEVLFNYLLNRIRRNKK